jgi:hypothetical protein
MSTYEPFSGWLRLSLYIGLQSVFVVNFDGHRGPPKVSYVNIKR